MDKITLTPLTWPGIVTPVFWFCVIMAAMFYCRWRIRKGWNEASPDLRQLAEGEKWKNEKIEAEEEDNSLIDLYKSLNKHN